MPISSQSSVDASTNAVPVNTAGENAEEHRFTDQQSPPSYRQESDFSARESHFRSPGENQYPSEHSQYQRSHSYDSSLTLETQPRNRTRNPTSEDGRDESIPLRGLGERDQEPHYPLGQKDRQRSRDIEPHNVMELSTFRVWWLEVAACVLILLMLAAIVGTLYPYRGQPIPSWPYNLSTNTIIAFYVLILKIALISVISAGLGQLKWSWFHEKRPLHNLGQYDEATRGPWGSLTILLGTTLRAKAALPSIGALIMILATILEPMGQQILQMYPCAFEDSDTSAAIPVSHYAAVGLGARVGAGIETLRIGSQSAINAGVFDTVPKNVSPTCPTGNCTFTSEYVSAGWCSRCVDVSEQLQRTPTRISTTPNYTLPSSNLSAGPGQGVNFIVQPESPYSLDFQAIMAVPDMGINSTAWTRRGYGAAQCTFYPCARRYSARVSFGLFSESTVSQPAEILSSSGSGWPSLIDVQCLNPQEKASLQKEGYNIESGQDWLNYNLSEWATRAYDAESDHVNASVTNIRPECIYQTFRDNFLSLGNFLGPFLSGKLQAIRGISGTSSVIEALFNETNISFESIDSTFSRIAQSLTVWARQDKDMSNGTVVTGLAYRNETCIRAQWLWLIYPAVLAALTVVFLCWTIAHTRRYDDSRQDYKTALLPLMFIGLVGSDTERRSQPEVKSLAEVKKRAKALDVRLENTESGRKFVVFGRA